MNLKLSRNCWTFDLVILLQGPVRGGLCPHQSWLPCRLGDPAHTSSQTQDMPNISSWRTTKERFSSLSSFNSLPTKLTWTDKTSACQVIRGVELNLPKPVQQIAGLHTQTSSPSLPSQWASSSLQTPSWWRSSTRSSSSWYSQDW